MSMGDESDCLVVWTLFSTALLRNWDEDWPFPVLWPLLGFQVCWHVQVALLTALSLRILNSSAGIPSPPLALLTAVLPKAHLTSQPRMSVSGWVTTPSWLSGSLRPFLVQFCVSFPSLLLLLGLYCFCPFLCPSLAEMFLCYFQFSWTDL